MLLLGVVMFAALTGLVVADVGVYLRSRAIASTAADAAALAAAPMTFADFGAGGGPVAGAAALAAANGAVLVRCDCPLNATWNRRTVAVVVAVPTTLALFGDHTVTASSTAGFDPTRLPPSHPP